MEAVETSDDKVEVGCGRAIFRGADLAFLLIEEERMFPLAELLASLFSNTARTTLFTRMEKFSTRRHFCDAQEIKLLKTVNGIHGSSAICTLIPEADVERYCSVYVDGTTDLKSFAKAKRTRKSSGKERSKRKPTESIKSVDEDNGEDNGKLTSPGENDDCKGKVDIAKSVKRKRRIVRKQGFNDSIKAKGCREEENRVLVMKSEPSGDLLGREDTALSDHVTNSSETLSLLSDEPAKSKKRRVHNHRNCNDGEFNGQIEQNKRPRNVVVEVTELYSPLKVLQPPNEADQTGVRKVTDDSNASGFSSSTCTGEAISENHNGQNLASCLRNANSEILFSDASSNDSGFASTATLSLKATSTTSTPTKDQFSSNKCETCSSPTKVKKKSPKKIKLEPVSCCNSIGNLDVSLSPPALVIKRQNNTWQVEMKQEHEQETRKPTKSVKTAIKKKSNLLASGIEGSIKTENHEFINVLEKRVKKRRRRRKLNMDNIVVDSKSEEVPDLNSKSADGKNVIKRRRRKNNNGEAAVSINATLNGLTPCLNIKLEPGTVQPKKNVSFKKFKSKKGKLAKKSFNHVLGEVKGALPSSSTETMVTPSPVTPASTSSLSPCKINLTNGKKAGSTNPKGKAYRNFKFISMFPAFPAFEVQDGDICPAFSMIVPQGVKPTLSHPVWKWHLGAPVIGNKNNNHVNRYSNSLDNTPVKMG